MNERKGVTLSTGYTIQMGPLKWGAYKALKSRVLQIIGNDLASAISGLSVTSLKSASEETLTQAGQQLASVLASVGEKLELLNEDFIRGCIADGADLDIDSLSVDDIQALFNAALEINPVEQMLAREKNSPAAQLGRKLAESVGMVLSGTPDKGDPDNGGSTSSPSLAEVTAGGAYGT